MSFGYKKHYNWPEFEKNDGSGNKKLSEPVPKFPKRTGDLVITGAGLSKSGQNNNAQIVIGAHGAGLCNLIFCKPKTKVIEFTNKEFKCEVFKNISKYNDLDYLKLKSESEIPKDRINPDIFVSLKDLEKLI